MACQQENSPWTYSDSVRQYCVSGTEFLQRDQNCQYDHLVIGVAVFSEPILEGNPKLLVVQRAATEDQFPNMYELPGGHVESTDKSILHTVVRETFEETGLQVSHISCALDPFEYESKSKSGRTKKTLQLNFSVLVKDKSTIQLSPEEHQAYRWISLQETDDLITTDAMRGVIENALSNNSLTSLQ